MKVNPYVAAAVMALVSGLTVLHGALGDNKLTYAEGVSAVIALLVSLAAALHIEPPRKDDKKDVEKEVVYVPTNEH